MTERRLACKRWIDGFLACSDCARFGPPNRRALPPPLTVGPSPNSQPPRAACVPRVRLHACMRACARSCFRACFRACARLRQCLLCGEAWVRACVGALVRDCVLLACVRAVVHASLREVVRARVHVVEWGTFKMTVCVGCGLEWVY